MPRRWSGLAIVALLLHAIWVVIFVWLLISVLSEPSIVVASKCKLSCKAVDLIRTAAVMGRFEFMSLALAILGIIIAVSAFGGFFLIRSAAINAAHDETDAAMGRLGRKWIDDHMVEHGGELVGLWLKNNPGELRKAVDVAGAVDQVSDPDKMIEEMDKNGDDS